MNAPGATVNAEVTGVILAGGRARRMGGVDKGLIELAGVTLMAHVHDALRGQVRNVLINANRNLDRYREFGAEVVTDRRAGYLGPLAGMAAAMHAAATGVIGTVPCDSPFVPPDLICRLYGALAASGDDIAVASDGERLQPVFLLAPTRLQSDLEAFLDSGERKIDRWLARHAVQVVDFSDCPDAFLNINTPAERDAIERRLLGALAAPTMGTGS